VQVLGRILRRGSDESIVRQVVDIVDVRTGLKGQAADRRKVYRAKGYPISTVRVSWDAADLADDGAAAPDDPGEPDGDAAGDPAGDFVDMTPEELFAEMYGT
jgi:hypothetical protein